MLCERVLRSRGEGLHSRTFGSHSSLCLLRKHLENNKTSLKKIENSSASEDTNRCVEKKTDK